MGQVARLRSLYRPHATHRPRHRPHRLANHYGRAISSHGLKFRNMSATTTNLAPGPPRLSSIQGREKTPAQECERPS